MEMFNKYCSLSRSSHVLELSSSRVPKRAPYNLISAESERSRFSKDILEIDPRDSCSHYLSAADSDLNVVRKWITDELYVIHVPTIPQVVGEILMTSVDSGGGDGQKLRFDWSSCTGLCQ